MRQEIADFMNLLFWDSLSIRHLFIEMFSQKIFDESYSQLTLSPKNIEASLRTVLMSLERKDNQSILDKLNSEFIKINVCFEETDKTMLQKYHDSGIVYAEADLCIYIYVNERFFDIVNSVELTQQSDELTQLSKDIFKIYSHEITHVEQNQKQRVNQPTLLPPQNSSLSERDRYLSNVREIDAHARELANYLLSSKFSKKEIERLLTTKQGYQELMNNHVFKIYFDNFGMASYLPKHQRDKDSQWRVTVFKRFKKRVCDFLLLDESFMYHKEFRFC